MSDILAEHHGPKRLVKGTAHRYYPAAPKVLDVPIVGRAEIIEMVGGDPENRHKQAWFYRQLQRGLFPAHDGPLIDGRPTWQRDTMLVNLYLRTKDIGRRRRYLIDELHCEARSLLLDMGIDPDTATIDSDDYMDDDEA